MTANILNKYQTRFGEIITIRRNRGYDHWYCGYVKCKPSETITINYPEFPRQGYADNGEVMFFDDPELGLEGWYYFWDTAHYGMPNTEEYLVDLILSCLE